jgi:hypothetical protein
MKKRVLTGRFKSVIASTSPDSQDVYRINFVMLSPDLSGRNIWAMINCLMPDSSPRYIGVQNDTY